MAMYVASHTHISTNLGKRDVHIRIILGQQDPHLPFFLPKPGDEQPLKHLVKYK